MPAYQLLAYLTHLTLVGQEDGELQWVGTTKEWEAVEQDINNFETFA